MDSFFIISTTNLINTKTTNYSKKIALIYKYICELYFKKV